MPITPSVLDRLIDPGPAAYVEAGAVRPDTIEGLESAVFRDLSALLNTRRKEALIPEEYQQANTSLLNFGLPDFTLYGLRNPHDQQRLRRAIETAIRVFEPRLSAVKVTLQPPDLIHPLLRFRVEAVLKAEPVAEPIAFDTVLRADTEQFSIEPRP